MEFTVVTWLWRGWNPIYGPEDVNRLKRKLEEHMSVPFRFVCITDDATGLECETYPLWGLEVVEDPKRRERIIDDQMEALKSRGQSKARSACTPLLPDCYRRLRLFDPEVGKRFGAYILSLDLDVEVFDDLVPLLSFDDDFKIVEGLSRAPYCGTMWWLKTGCYPEVWTDFDPVEAPKILARAEYNGRPLVGSDQAWLAVKLPGMPVWKNDGSEGVYFIRRLVTAPGPVRSKKPEGARLVYAAGRIKTTSPECRMMVPWLYEAATC